MINDNGLDYTQFFKLIDSAEMVEPDANFDKPFYFDDKLNDVKRRIA